MKNLAEMTEPELGQLMRTCAARVDRELAAHTAERPKFVLLVFDDPKVAQYISSCRREDMVKTLREAADRIEKNTVVPRVEFPR